MAQEGVITLLNEGRFQAQRRVLFAILKRLSYEYREEPIKLKHGGTSHEYLDGRQTALTANGAALIGQLFHYLIQRYCPEVRAVGGLTLGADPIVSSILTIAGLAYPLHNLEAGFLVRDKAKDHGQKDKLVGAKHLPGSSKVAVVDDVITSGGSMFEAIDAAEQRMLKPDPEVEKFVPAPFNVVAAFAVLDREENDGLAKIKTRVPFAMALFRKSEFTNGKCEDLELP